jgi:hypothetical protein
MVDVSIAEDRPGHQGTGVRKLQPVREHRRFIIVFVISAMLTALALTYIFSEAYRARTTIFFKTSEMTQLANHRTQALGSPYPSNTGFKAICQRIAQTLDGDALLRQVVRDRHLDAPKPRNISGPWLARYYKQAATERSYGAASDRLRVLNQIQARYVILSAQLKRDFSSLSDAYKEPMIPATSGESELRLQAKATAPPVPISPVEIYHVITTGFLVLAVAIGSRGQDAPIHATESYEALTPCWKFVSGEQLVEGEKW